MSLEFHQDWDKPPPQSVGHIRLCQWVSGTSVLEDWIPRQELQSVKALGAEQSILLQMGKGSGKPTEGVLSCGLMKPVSWGLGYRG